MKKHLFIILSFASISTFGQVIPKGTRFIGGDLGLGINQTKVEGEVQGKSTSIGITPSLTKFVKDNFAITYSLGYNIGISGGRANAYNEFKTNTAHSISAGVYLRNYMMLSEKLGVAVSYGGSLGYQISSFSSGAKGPQGLTLNISAGPGIIYLVNDKFAIEGTTSIANLTAGYTWLDNTNIVNLSLGVSASPGLGIGFRYFLK